MGSHDWSRRDVLAVSAATTAAIASPSAFAISGGRATLRVGLIGCGGRGTGAAIDHLGPNTGVELVAMGDVFPDRLESSAGHLKEQLKEKFKVTDAHRFVGFDAYQQVIASDCDIVILATPPGFRPVHLRAAVDAGKHVFMEKPVAVDAPGVRSVIESGTIADAKGLSIVAGTQRRHDIAYQEVVNRVRDGAIGDVVATYAYWNQGGLWMNPREDKWTDMEWQLRNWLYFTWLSGDHICEQHIHNLDVCNWAHGAHPVKAVGMGGRQVRIEPAYGHIFDHFAIEYTYADGATMTSYSRQIDGTASRVGETLVGTKGKVNTTMSGAMSIVGGSPYTFSGDRPNPYEVEHADLLKSIRGGKRINEAKQVAESTLTAIMGRLSAYSGKEVAWDAVLASTESLMPHDLAFGPLEVPSVAMPGQSRTW